MTATNDTSDAETPPAEHEQRQPADRLTRWLGGLVRRHDLGALADLRRPKTALTQSHFLAMSYAPSASDDEVYRLVAFLFARYHAGASLPSYGRGNLGTALRKVGSGAVRGPEDPGADRLMARISASRAIPERHLQHAIERMRAGDTAPPSWSMLVDDLSRWTDHGRPAAFEWTRDFYTPNRTKYGAKK
ncbi:CRISPR-associated protein [Nocardia nova SH22a]|uniref:CRISPR-associated protein n=1 Tax=Nocardia nova SH22a TaxID=1415166 RepID=W5TBI4_9NOCA|nr:type I-E CRISPR-associated protein Cse2/CasB [Nocardia nova]AHH16504.1 CRISPR-associated protein [Nocardia nova SH22a]